MILIYTTHPDLATAKKIAQVLLEQKLVACANLLPPMDSLYWWEGKMEEAKEVIGLFKTQADLFELCQAAIKKYHPYSVPCIVQIDLSKGEETYFHWLATQVRAPN